MKIDNFFFHLLPSIVSQKRQMMHQREMKKVIETFWKIIHYGCCFKNVSQPKFYKSQAILNHTFKLTKQSVANFFYDRMNDLKYQDYFVAKY